MHSVVFVLSASLWAGACAWAGPVALAVDVEGEITPSVEPFTELESGARITLARDARMEFLHYMSCQSVSVHGGEVYFSDESFHPSAQARVEVERTRCPERIRLAAEGTAAALTLRTDGDDQLRLGGDAAFLLVGPLAGQVEVIRILRDADIRFEGRPSGVEFRLPAGHEWLADGGRYQVEILGGNGLWAREFSALVDHRRRGGRLALVRVE